MAGYTNGAGKKPDEPERRTNITSLEEVRKRAEAEGRAQAKAAKKATHRSGSWREMVVGLVLISMALGTILAWLAPMLGLSGVAR